MRETPRIAAFAGVERHLDTPIKRYSSGMQARLSFATAICFPADIYIFDEVLAVVDDDFRERCARELAELNAQGRTVVFMSHDLELVRSMCSTGMWLDRGRVALARRHRRGRGSVTRATDARGRHLALARPPAATVPI